MTDNLTCLKEMIATSEATEEARARKLIRLGLTDETKHPYEIMRELQEFQGTERSFRQALQASIDVLEPPQF